MATEAPLPDIKFSCSIFDIVFHPLQDIVATGLVSGKLDLHRYGAGSIKRLLTTQLHSDSVRSIAFSDDGQRLYSGSRDKSIKCVDASGTVVWEHANAHTGGVNVVVPYGGHLVATADDEGGIKLWDTRTPSPAIAFYAYHEDLVNDVVVDAARSVLLSASADGTLGVVDLRKGRQLARTEQEEDELLSLAVIKGGNAVVVGTQDGVLLTWKWGKWTFSDKDAEDGPQRFTGHPESIDALLPVDDDAIVTGSSDGIIRLVTVQPNKLVGVLGEHGEDPIERLAWSRDRRYIASAGHDDTLKFWDVAYLFEDDEEEETAAAEGGAAAGTRSGSSKNSRFTSLPALSMPRRSEEGEDDDEEEDDEEDEEDDEEGDEDMEGAAPSKPAKGAGKLKQSRRGGAKGKGASGAAAGKKKKGASGGAGKAGFFDDL